MTAHPQPTSDPDAPAEAAPGRRGSAPGDPAQPGG